ncbi:MAG TPA: PilZ domain-containing protein [Myxococcota bacterium]
MREQARDAVLVIGFAGVSGGVATRLIALGFRPISVTDPQAAAARVEREHVPVRAAIVPTSADFLVPGGLWRLARANGLSSRRFIALGPPVEEADAARIRRAGVRFLLTEPCTDRELRFAVNRALYDEHGQSRSRARVATDLIARVRMGAREKAGLVYSLSSDGCYLETDRPCLPETFVSLQLPLPGGAVELPARVLYTNVTGDFHRPNLPRGMALSLLSGGAPERAAIGAYVAERLAEQGIEPRGDDAVVQSVMTRVWARVRARIAPSWARATT